MFGSRFEAHSHRSSRIGRSWLRGGWLRGPWLRNGLLLLVLPVGAAACHGRSHRHADLTEAELKERAADHVDDAMDWIDGTDNQKQQVRQVVDKLIPDLMGYRNEQRALRTEFQNALSAPTVDPTALEDLRVRFLRLADVTTARGAQALTAVAQILTPQQRQKIIEKWRKFQD